MSELISVLMGVYNAKSNVVQAVHTIEEQTVEEIEFVICDDGSDDGTFSILQTLADEYENIILLKNDENMGLANALNRCFAVSSGDYIARMDVDDRCVKERFAIQRKFLQMHPEYDLVGSLMVMVDDNENETYSVAENQPMADVLPLKVPFAHPTVLMRREVLENLGGYSAEKHTRRCEDLELWYRFFAMEMRGYNLQEYLYIKTEGLADYRRRKVSAGWGMFQTHIKGLRMIRAPWYKYILAVKPVISAMVPKRVMMKYHAMKFSAKTDD